MENSSQLIMQITARYLIFAIKSTKGLKSHIHGKNLEEGQKQVGLQTELHGLQIFCYLTK